MSYYVGQIKPAVANIGVQLGRRKSSGREARRPALASWDEEPFGDILVTNAPMPWGTWGRVEMGGIRAFSWYWWGCFSKGREMSNTSRRISLYSVFRHIQAQNTKPTLEPRVTTKISKSREVEFGGIPREIRTLSSK